jgi:hypothetical protein
MYLGSWKIDDFLTFPVNTHTPSTGAATDADAVPTYRVYEDETGTAVANGSMAKLDDANTLGFYSERIQLLTATGFESGKCYTIYITATVGSIAGTLSHTFQIQAEVSLHADWVNGGRLDLLLDVCKAIADDWLNAGRLDVILDAINERTGNLPDDPADQSLIIAATNAIATQLDGIEGAGFVTGTDSLEAIRNRGDIAWATGVVAGAGAIQWSYTLTNSVGGAPIAEADVWVTTDIAGTNVVASGKTDAFGVVTFYLDAGVHYIWRQKSGWNFTNPDTETVS